MRGPIPPLPNTPSWRDAQLKHRTTLPLPLLLKYKNKSTRNVGLEVCAIGKRGT